MGGEARRLMDRGWLYHPEYPDDWERRPLYSLAQWVNGLAFRDIQFSASGMPVIKIAEIKGGISEQTKFTQQTFDDSVRVRAGDLLFSWSGQPETSIDAFWWRGPEGWLNQHVFRVTPADGIDLTFLYYLLRYLKPNFIGIARNKQTTGLGHVTKRDLENMEAAYPELPEQRAIAHILGTLDDKIELNRRMSETLEAMARALFKAWFIDFDPVRRNMARKRGQNQPSPRSPLPLGEGRRGEGAKHEGSVNYRGGYNFAGLVETARELRKKQTQAEAIFWEMVRDRQLLGLKFRRQHQLGDYIVDFYCHEHRLVVEFDGRIHRDKRAKDHKRDAWLDTQGFKVLRFKNEQLLDDPKSVLTAIAQVVEGRAFDHLFPDRLVPSELGEMPEGWGVVELGELIDTVKGCSYKSDELVESDTALVTLKSFARGGGYRPDGLKSFAGAYKAEQVVNPGEVVIACTDVTQAAEVIGRAAIVRGTGVYQRLVASLDTLIVRPRDSRMNRSFLYFLAGTEAFVTHMYAYTTGTTVLHLAKDAASSFMFAYPSYQLVEKFHALTAPTLDLIQGLEEETRTLAALRDALLPKLISGEIRVRDAERFLRERGL